MAAFSSTGFDRRMRPRPTITLQEAMALTGDEEVRAEIRDSIEKRARWNNPEFQCGRRLEPVLSPGDGGAVEYDRDADGRTPAYEF